MGKCWLWLLLLLGGGSTLAGAQNTRIVDIVIRGNRAISQEAIRAAMQMRVGEPFSKEGLEKDRQAIQALGYFTSVVPQAEQTETGVRVTIDLVENPQIREVRFLGNSVLTSEQLLAVIQNKPGRVLNFNLIRSDQGAIEARYEQADYVARVVDYRASESDNSLLEIVVQELRIGNITIVGNRKTRPYVILREVRSKAGELFRPSRWRRDLIRLYNLEYFESIDPQFETPAPGMLDIQIRVKEKPTGRINLGFALDSRRRLVGLLEVYETNFRGLGQTLGINFQSTGGAAGNSVELLFSEPWLDRRHTSLSVSLYNKLVYRFTSNFFGGSVDPNLEQRYDERRRGGFLNLSRPLSEALSVGLGLRAEEVSTNRVATDQQTGFIRQDGSLLSLSLRGVRNTRDFDLDPATGSYLALSLEPGVIHIKGVDPGFEDLVPLGRHNFLRASLDVRYYYSPQGARTKPDDRRHVFAFRAMYGTIGGTVPFFEQFFIGGAETLRGYPEDRFWGKNSFLLSAEYRIPLQKAFTGVLFVDYGDAWGGYPTVNQFTQHSSFHPQAGFGFGIRVGTPLGPIRIDYGIGRDGARTHFSIGQIF